MIVVVGEAALVMVAVLGPLTCVQAPVPVVAVFAAMVAEPLVAQMFWSGPALATVGGAFTVMMTSSEEAVQGLFAAVQRKVRAPAVLRPEIVVVGDEALVIVAAVPLTCVHVPEPVVMVLPAIVTLPVVVQIV